MNNWVAMTMAADFRQGGRFYVMEAMHAPGWPRPPYAAGDRISVEETNGPRTVGTIDAASAHSFDATFEGSVRLRFVPTPPDAPRPSLTSDIPFDDMFARPL